MNNINKQKGNSDQSEDVMENLRRLLLRPEQEKLNKLEERFDNRVSFIEEISEILPEAVAHRSTKDQKLDDALTPVIEKTLKSSVKKDINSFADALYPVMGPAIRKSISETFKELLQSMNVALENSFSLKGIKWRLQSMRTGKPFSEIVLLNSLIYRVEQVFLIHRKTGCLLQHMTADENEGESADMVSGMFTAISDFAKDSFSANDNSTLNSFRVGDLNVLLETGPLATLALAIRGESPQSLRTDMHSTLEIIHYTQRGDLAAYSGDIAPFEKVRPYLKDCLQMQYQKEGNEEKSIFSVKVIFVLLLFFLPLIWWSVYKFDQNSSWNNYLKKLKQEPGVVITNIKEKSGKYYIEGLRDPLSKNPIALKPKDFSIKPEDIIYSLSPYQSLVPKMIIKRAGIFLEKPDEVKFSLKSGILYSSGKASYQWKLKANKNYKYLSGVNSYNDKNLLIFEFLKLKKIIFNLEQKKILFYTGKFNTPIQPKKLELILVEIKNLIKFSKKIDKKIKITIEGHADGTGSKKRNISLSVTRSLNIYKYLVRNGVSEIYLKTEGRPSSLFSEQYPSEQKRSVQFFVSILKD